MAFVPVQYGYTVRVLAAELPTIFFTTGTWTATRTSAGIYSMAVGAADQTCTIEVPISHVVSRINRNTNDSGAPNAFRGLRLMAVTYAYGIGVADMDAHSADIIRVQHNEILAPTVTTAVGGTLTPALSIVSGTITTTGMHRTTQTLPTPIFLNPNQEDEGLFYVVTVNQATTTTYRAHEFAFNFSIVQ